MPKAEMIPAPDPAHAAAVMLYHAITTGDEAEVLRVMEQIAVHQRRKRIEAAAAPFERPHVWTEELARAAGGGDFKAFYLARYGPFPGRHWAGRDEESIPTVLNRVIDAIDAYLSRVEP